MSRKGEGVGPPEGSKKNTRKSVAAEARARAERVIDAGLPAVIDSEGLHRKAVVEALAKNALAHMLEHRGTSLRLRRLLSANLGEVEAMIEAIPDSAMLVGHLSHLTPEVRTAIHHAIGLPNRIEAVERMVTTFGKLVAVDKELLALPELADESVKPVDEDRSALTQEERDRIERIRQRFSNFKPSAQPVTDVNAA